MAPGNNFGHLCRHFTLSSLRDHANKPKGRAKKDKAKGEVILPSKNAKGEGDIPDIFTFTRAVRVGPSQWIDIYEELK